MEKIRTCKSCGKRFTVKNLGRPREYCVKCAPSRTKGPEIDHSEGYKYDEDRRLAIAEGKRRADAYRFATEGEPPDKWRCPRCKQWKIIDGDHENGIGTRRYVTKTGIERTHVRDCCKKCDSQRQKERRDAILAVGGAVAEDFRRRRRAASNKNNHKRRAKKRRQRGSRLPARPLVEWFERKLANGYAGNISLLAENCGVDSRVILRIRHQRTVTEDMVDRVLTKEGSTDLWELYPDLYV